MSKPASPQKPRWRIQFEQGQALLAGGESAAAIAPLRKAVELNPNLAPAWRLLGDILTAAGQFAAADEAFDRRAAVWIGDARTASVDVRQRQGESLRRQGHLGEAGQILSACLAEAPDSYEARLSLARVLLSARRFPEAISQFHVLLARDGADVRSLAMKAAALTEIGRYGEAAEITAIVAKTFPDQVYPWLVHASALRTLGDAPAAIEAWRRCVALDPACAEAWLGLANLKTYRFSADQIAAMESAAQGHGLSDEDRAKVHFALGKASEDGGDDATAFEHYREGNALERARRAYDPDLTSDYARRCEALFTAAFLAQRRGWGARAHDPIFIVGLPRSGSTLVEQILASHSAIEGTHELPDLPMLASSIAGYPEGLAHLNREACVKLGEEYLLRTRAYRNLDRPRFIDKTPKNFQHIGFIRMVLPGAKIIDVRRHPLACGVSVFRQHFGQGFNTAFDLGHIGRYYADYVELMAHFDAVDPGAIHRLIYEDLVADTEGEVRRLLSFLGLSFEPACLRFFENRRPVDTPSAEQVRRPIFTNAVEDWRRFEPWLGPLKAALGPALESYPAAPQY
ncbi:MAG TPA: sulfotransferase [Caulobacteraceae bacterium]|jgi:tetratricopeptide (TPR) repeat protein